MTTRRTGRWMTTRVAALVCGLALAFGAAGLSATAASAASKSTVATAKVPGVGTVLVDAQGKTLYTLTDADGQAVACTGTCASAWPPLTASGKVTSPKAVKKLHKTTGTNQVTSAGLPLYRFAGDSAAKQANGEGLSSFGGTWHVVRVKATKTATTPTTAGKSSGYSGY